MHKRKLQSVGRKLLIAVLLAAAVLLGRETGYFSARRGSLFSAAQEGMEHSASAETGYARATGAAMPLAAVVCLPDGGRCGAAYNEGTVTAVFHRFSADLGEALGSAGAPTELTEAEFCRDCLGGCGLFLRYDCPRPLDMLTAWLGAEMTGAAAAHRAEIVFLRAGEASVELCYRTDDGLYYHCATAVSPVGLRSRLAEYPPNGTEFVFEKETISGGDACAVLLQGAMRADVVSAPVSLPTGEDQDSLLQAMGMNSYVSSSYTEADGTIVFVDEDATIRMNPAGSVFFRRNTLPGDAQQNVNTAVDLAWQTAERSIGRACGDAQLIYAGTVSDEAQRSVTVLLDYAVNGIPVRLAAGHAAEITLRGNTVVAAGLVFRRCTVTEDYETLLPFLQANAIAAAEGSAAELIYSDRGETLNCVWVKTDG